MVEEKPARGAEGSRDSAAARSIRTVLCPVDFTTLADDTLQLAVDLCRRAGARLVLHHNLGPAPPDFLGVHWMWDEEHGPGSEREEKTVTEELGKIFATLPDDVEYEAKLSRGPLAEGVLFLARELPAELVVLGSHGGSSPEHRSLTEQIVLRAPCPVLATSESWSRTPLERAAGEDAARRPILAATDLSGHDRGAVTLAFDLARALAREVHLVHVLAPTKTSAEKRRAAESRARDRLQALVESDLAPRSRVHLRWGAPGAEVLAMAKELDVLFLLLGARRHGLLHRALKGLTSLEVLRGSRWPVWFVPADRTPAGLSPGAG